MKQVSDPLPRSVPLATVYRSGRPESVHCGSVAIVRADGTVHAFGDIEQPIYARSAVKPLQALPLLERGVAERAGFDDADLALISASHDGTPAHVDVVRRLLERGGMSEDDLLCGPHAPFDRAASLAIARSGRKPTRLHNNCSGKHAGFLWLSDALGAERRDYLDPAGVVQQTVREAVASMAEVPADGLEVGVDGCGAPTFRLPLVGLARAFFRLTNPAGLSPVRAAACTRMLDAVGRQPFLLAGTKRLCTALIGSAPGRVYPKNGAEGVYALGVTGGFGLAIKVADGHERGYIPVVVEVLARLGLWPQVPASLAAFHRIPLHNTRKQDVGEVACTFDARDLDAGASEAM